MAKHKTLLADRYRRWVRAHDSMLWNTDALPYWCVCSYYQKNARGALERLYVAKCHGVTVGEIQRSHDPRRVIDAVEDMLRYEVKGCKHIEDIDETL